MLEWLSQYSPKELMGLFAIVGGLLLAGTAVVTAQWSRVRRAELHAHQMDAELTLKQQMIERGMSADEIDQVLAAHQMQPTNRKVRALHS